MEEDLLEEWAKDNPVQAEKFMNVLTELFIKYRPKIEELEKQEQQEQEQNHIN